MVRFPKNIKTFCRKCKIHRVHKVFEYKSGKPSLKAQGKRRYDRKQKGFKGQTKPIFRKKIKTSKIVSVRLKCTDCESSLMKRLNRAKKIEILSSNK